MDCSCPTVLDVGEVERDVAPVADGGGLFTMRRIAITSLVCQTPMLVVVLLAHFHGVGGRHELFYT